MSPDSLVGVVVPVLNGEGWLGEALDSILVQRHRPLDVVVIDDGSDDASGAIAQRYGPPVRVARQRRSGIGAARNRGVELVRGDLLAFCDADDLWTSSRLQRPLRALRNDPELDVVFGHVRSFAETLDGAPVALDEPRPAELPSAMLIRRAAFERVGRFVTGTRVAESLDWMLRAREQPLRELVVDDQVLWRRIHGQNNSLRYRDARVEYARALRVSLQRRRAAR